jgi:hypothetical protein
MADSTYKEQFIETEYEMDKAFERLLAANEISAIKSFFCMYLIRPRVSLASVSVGRSFIHLEGRFRGF